jgi:hypothetical protein
MGRTFGWDRKNRGSVSQQVLHDKDPSLFKGPSIGLNFAALHRQWWRLYVSEKFLSKTVNNQSINHSSGNKIAEIPNTHVVISLETQVEITSQRNDWTSGHTGGGIRCVGGIHTPCLPVTHAAVNTILNGKISSQNWCVQIRQTVQSTVIISADI